MRTNWLRNDTRFPVFYRPGAPIDFVPVDWLSWLPEEGLDYRKAPKSWLVLRLEACPHGLDFYAEVRRMKDVDRRKQIVAALLDAGPKLGLIKKQKSTVTVKDSYTRLSSRERILAWQDEANPPRNGSDSSGTRQDSERANA